MTSMWTTSVRSRWRRARSADAQARFLTLASLRWVLRNRAYSPWYLVRYFRLAKFRLAHPHIVLKGMVFLGKDVEIHAVPGQSRLEIGRWVHIGDGNKFRCHEGSLRIGDKSVFGNDNVINCYLDIEFGAASLVADWCYFTDFDHKMDDIHIPIKDQGIVKGPVRIGGDTWVGTKVTVTRNTIVGHGSVLGAHSVVRGEIPPYSIAVGTPARAVRNRKQMWDANAAERAELERALADIERKKAKARGLRES